MSPLRRRLMTEAVNEVRYLAAGANTNRYRLIMRYFLQQHRLHHYALSPSQVLHHLRSILPDYSEEDCQQDLDALVRWENLNPDWELGLASVRTIEDFKRRNVVYTATPDAIAIEELMLELEQRGQQVGELDASAIGRLWEQLAPLEAALALPFSDQSRPERLRQAWEDLWLRFDQLATSSNNYLGNMRSQERERLLDLDAFQIYKQTLIRYLTDFVEGLSAHSERFRRQAEGWDAESMAAAMAQAAHATTHSFESLDHLLRRYQEQIQAFLDWFATGGSANQLRVFASHAIERVVRSARRLSESRRGAVSRAHDLLALADRFQACQELPHAQRLAAAAFGLTHPRHWQLEVPEQADDRPELSAWAAAPRETVIRQRRATQSRRAGDGAADLAELAEKRARLRALDRQRQTEAAAIVDRLFGGGALVLGETDNLNPSERDLILGWAYECLANAPAYSTRTPDGSTLQIANPAVQRYIWLCADDGRMLVPNYRLVRCQEGA